MLTPEYFEDAADDMIKLYQQLEDSVIDDMCRRIARLNGITEGTIYQAKRLNESGILYREIIQKVSKITGISAYTLRDIFEKAAKEAIESDDKIYKQAGLNPPLLLQSKAMLEVLQAGLEKTHGIIRNLTLTTAAVTQQSYIQACDLAYMQVSSGAMSYQAAIASAVKRAANGGLKILYPKTGWVDQLDVAIRRATLTGVNQTCGQAQIMRMDEMDVELVETTAHSGARPSHIVWQGKIFCRRGKSNKYPDFVSVTGYGSVTGLCGANCRHSFFPYFEGLSKSAYSENTFEQYKNQKVRYQEKEYTYYEATQIQRSWERRIRATKRELIGLNGCLKEMPENEVAKKEFEKQSVKLKKQEAKLKDFLKQTGLDRQRNREQVYAGKYGGFGRSISQKAVWANKRVAKQSKRDIIKLSHKEQAALNEYISSGSYKINDKLRNRVKLNKEELDFVSNLDRALKKMPTYSGDLIRTVYFDDKEELQKFLNSHKLKSSKTYKEYISTSTGKDYNSKGNVKIYIQNSKSGRDIQKYNPLEKEVLYERNFTFKVLDKTKKDGIYYILLEEA